MRTREQIMAEMIRVAEALERPGLTPEQRARGEAKYAALEEELAQLEQGNQAQQERQEQTYTDPRVDAAIKRIWSTLDPEGKRRRKHG